MDEIQSAHLARVRHLRESFAAANERLVSRLRAASDEAAERHVADGWSAAQIGWHVATVSTRFAAMIAGDMPGPQPLAESFEERPWAEVAAAIPDQLRAPSAVHPPPGVKRSDAVVRAGELRDEDGACVRRADPRARHAAWGSPTPWSAPLRCISLPSGRLPTSRVTTSRRSGCSAKGDPQLSGAAG